MAGQKEHNSTEVTEMRLQSVKSRNIGSVKAVLCPETIKLYNQYMNGIDHTDQLRSMYNTARKALKWRKYLFFFLFDVAMVNVYLLMRVSAQHVLKKKTPKNYKNQTAQMEFRIQ